MLLAVVETSHRPILGVPEAGRLDGGVLDLLAVGPVHRLPAVAGEGAVEVSREVVAVAPDAEASQLRIVGGDARRGTVVRIEDPDFRIDLGVGRTGPEPDYHDGSACDENALHEAFQWRHHFFSFV